MRLYAEIGCRWEANGRIKEARIGTITRGGRIDRFGARGIR